MRTVISAIAFGALLLGLSGCGSEQQPVPANEPTKKISYDFPLDAFYPTKAQDLAIQRAEGVLTARCMRRLGYAFDSPEPTAIDIRATRDRTFGLADAAEAARHGYTGPAVPEVAKPTAPKPSDAEYVALTGTELNTGELAAAGGGVPKDGCAGEAARQLTAGAKQVDPEALDKLTMHTVHQAEADQRVKGKFREWSKCMKAEGFSYADPWQPNDSPTWVVGKPTAVEKRTAVADVQCKHSTGLLDTWSSVLVEYQQALMKQYRADLDLISAQTKTRAASAELVLEAR